MQKPGRTAERKSLTPPLNCPPTDGKSQLSTIARLGGQLPGHSASRARPHAFAEPGRMPAARACWSGRDQVQGRHGAQGHDDWHVQPLRVAAQLLRCRIAGLIREQMFSGPSFRRSAANALHRVRLSESLAHRTADQSRCPRNRLESRWRLRQTMFNAPVERAPSGVVGNWRTMK